MENCIKILDNTLRDHLQKEVTLSINNKILRTGKFILYNFQDFHIELDIIYNNKIKKTMIPIPFSIEHYKEDCLLYLDYRVKTLFNKFEAVPEKENKFFNKILEIQFE